MNLVELRPERYTKNRLRKKIVFKKNTKKPQTNKEKKTE